MNQRIKEILGDLKILRGYKISDEKSFCERVAKQLGNLPEASSLMGEYDDIIEDAIEKEYERMKPVSNININKNREETPIVSSDDDIFKIFGTARTPNSQNQSNVNESSRVDTPIVPINIKDDKQKEKTVGITPVVRPRVNTEMIDKVKEKKAIDEVDLKNTTLRVYDILNNMKNIGEKIILKDKEYFCKRVAKKVLREVDDIDIVEYGEYDENIESIIRSEYQDLINGKWKFKEKEPLVKMNVDIENIRGINELRYYAQRYLNKLMEVLGYSYDSQYEVVDKILTLIKSDYYAGIISGKYEDYMKTLVISGSKEYEMILEAFSYDSRFTAFTQARRLKMLLEGSEELRRAEMFNNGRLVGAGFDQLVRRIANKILDKYYTDFMSKMDKAKDTAKDIGIIAAGGVAPITTLAAYGLIQHNNMNKIKAEYKQLNDILGVSQILEEEDTGRGRK